MFKFCFFLLIVISNNSLFGQNCAFTLSGKITDEHDQSPLDSSKIEIKELNLIAYSNSKGFYEFQNICSGKYTILVSHDSCDFAQKTVSISKNTSLNFLLEHHTDEQILVEIRAKRTESPRILATTELSQEKMNQTKGLALGEMLKNISGVTSLNTGNSISKPILHGMHSNRLLILNNGIRQEGQQWGSEHAPEIDPFIAGKLSVVKGANGVRYGSDAIAGVVLVDPREIRDSAGIGGELNVVGSSNGSTGVVSGFLEGRFAKFSPFSFRIQGTLKQGGTIHAPRYNLVNTGLKESNFSYTLAYQKPKHGIEVFYSQFNTKIGIFSGSHIGNLTDLKKAFESGEPQIKGNFTYDIERPNQQIEHELFKVKSFFNVNAKSKLVLVYGRQYNKRQEFDKHKPLNDSLAALNRPELQFELTTHTLDLILEHRIGTKVNGSLGASGMYQGNTYEGRALIPNFRNTNGGIFLIERWKHHKIELEAGFRYDYKKLEIFKFKFIGNGNYALIKPVHVFQNLTGNIGGVYKHSSTSTISLNFGTAWRAPSVNELYSFGLHHGAAAFEYGDDKLKSERTFNIISTIHYELNKKLTFDVSPYVHYIQGFIYRQPGTQPILSIHGAFPTFNYKQTEVTLTGVDINSNYQPTAKFEINAKASFLQTRDLSAKTYLIGMPSNRIEGELIYNLNNLKVFKENSFSISVLHITKQWRVLDQMDFAPPPPAYTLVNFNLSSKIQLGNQPLEIGFTITNLLNKSYRDYLDRFRYFADAMGRNFTFRAIVPLNFNFKKLQKAS